MRKKNLDKLSFSELKKEVEKLEKAKDNVKCNKLSFSELKKEVEKLEKAKDNVKCRKVSVWSVVKNMVLRRRVDAWVVGKNYVIRTVTMIQVGKLVDVTEQELVLEGAAWVAETDRYADFLSDGKVREVEPFPDGRVIVGRGAVIDACEWKHDLLRKQK